MIEDLEPMSFFSPWFLKVLIGNSIYSVALNKDIGTHINGDSVIYKSSAREIAPTLHNSQNCNK